MRIAGYREFVLRALVLIAISVSLGAGDGKDDPSPKPRYGETVRPILEAKCQRCHNAKVKKGGLDVSTHEALLAGGEGGPVVVPGRPDESPLYEVVHEGTMPADKKNKLSPAEVESVRVWIEGGASIGGESAGQASGKRLTDPTQHDIYPILLRRCTVCHGRDVHENGLDLRTRASMLKGGKSGPAILPGDPGRSLVLQKIHSGEMPPLRRVVEVSIKPIEPGEVELIGRWIALGAPELPIAPDVASAGPDTLVSDAEREFWAFRPPRQASIPAAGRSLAARNPIDAFIIERLVKKGLTLSPEADRRTLIRRLSLDLTGLPPEPAEVDAFLAERDPQAYEILVDRLLASPRYGERWGRHWLDVAGYSDTEGKREQHLPRASAWRYRDYVIRSLNADKPYDRFLTEQIAGDELADYEHAPEITQELEDNLVATGFLRMAPDPTWANPTNFVPDRVDIIADEIDVLGSGVLGLTLKCARCHSHKIDPIPQRDYYRLLDVFKGAYDENDWLRSGWDPVISKGRRCDRELTHVTTAERRRWEAHNAAIRSQVEKLKTRQKTESKETAAKTDGEIKSLEVQTLPEPTIRALWDRGEPSPTYIARRGDPMNAGPLVGPGVPSVLTDGRTVFEATPPWPGARSTGRRLAFAHWLTTPENPLTARVIVNRVWKHHFAIGLVPSLGNFGKAGSLPTHPKLLDWLAVEFIRRGWSFKALHRLIVTSATYRQSSAVTPELKRGDPDGRLYSRFPLKRVEAEVLQDSLLAIAGRLDTAPFGPADSVTVRADGLVTPSATSRGWRRSIYQRQNRKDVTTILEVFDLPLMNPNCVERRDSNVPTQALHLWNDGMVRELSAAFSRRVILLAGDDTGRQIDEAFRVALGRLPDAEERAASLEAIGRMQAEWSSMRPTAGPSSEMNPQARALTSFCHALLNSASFLYID